MPRKYQQGCVDVIALDDRLTGDEAQQLHALVAETVHTGLPQIVIDLRSVRLIDSAGLESLCDANDACRRRGGEMRVASANRVVRDVLRITGVDEQFGVCDDVIVAAGEFAQ